MICSYLKSLINFANLSIYLCFLSIVLLSVFSFLLFDAWLFRFHRLFNSWVFLFTLSLLFFSRSSFLNLPATVRMCRWTFSVLYALRVVVLRLSCLLIWTEMDFIRSFSRSWTTLLSFRHVRLLCCSQVTIAWIEVNIGWFKSTYHAFW